MIPSPYLYSAAMEVWHELTGFNQIPLNNVDVHPDGFDGYSVYGVYGDPRMWRPCCILHWWFPRQFKRDAKALGFDRLP